MVKKQKQKKQPDDIATAAIAAKTETMFLESLLASGNESKRGNAVIIQYLDIDSSGLFSKISNEILFEAMREVAKKGEPNTYVAIVEQLKNDGNLDKVGGVAVVTSLTAEAFKTSNGQAAAAERAKYYYNRLREIKIQRDIVQFGQTISALVSNSDNIGDLIDYASDELRKIRAANDERQDIDDKKRHTFSLIDLWDQQQKGLIPPPITTGNGIIDYACGGGIERKKFYVVAARPGHGKSTLACNMLYHFSLNEYKALYFSLEMSKEDILAKMVSHAAQLDIAKVRDIRNCDSDDEAEKIYNAGLSIADLPYSIDDAALTAEELCSRIRSEKSKHGLDIVIIDHLHMLYLADAKAVGTREQEVRKICNMLHNVAKNCNIAMIVLSQLNRNVEVRVDKVPLVSDLRDSGGLEEYSDAIFLLCRPFLYDQDQYSEDSFIIRCGKARMNGHVGTYDAYFYGKTSTISCPDSPTLTSFLSSTPAPEPPTQAKTERGKAAPRRGGRRGILGHVPNEGLESEYERKNREAAEAQTALGM